jgi:hypothetical protein
MLRTAAEGTVTVEFGQFVLQAKGGGSRYSALRLEPPAGRSWLVVGGPGGALFHSAGTDHLPFVRLELHDAEPNASNDAWDQMANAWFEVVGTTVQLQALTGEPWNGVPLVLPKPGRYRIRVQVRGTAAAEALGEATFAEGLEHWLLQAWPEPS